MSNEPFQTFSKKFRFKNSRTQQKKLSSSTLSEKFGTFLEEKIRFSSIFENLFQKIFWKTFLDFVFVFSKTLGLFSKDFLKSFFCQTNLFKLFRKNFVSKIRKCNKKSSLLALWVKILERFWKKKKIRFSSILEKLFQKIFWKTFLNFVFAKALELFSKDFLKNFFCQTNFFEELPFFKKPFKKLFWKCFQKLSWKIIF